MPIRRTHLAPKPARGQLEASLKALREKNDVPEGFPSAVIAEAESAEGNPPDLDLRDIPFMTLDPRGSRDLDQAFHMQRDGDRFVLHYAIADLPGFVRPGGALDTEARLRGQTLYLPDGSVPLHPRILSEDRASLLPDVDRSAFVWTIAIDETGAAVFEGGSVPTPRVERALIRSRARLNYPDAQAEIDAGSAHEQLELLREFGELRIAEERRRGGASLNMADEEIVCDEHGYRIVRSFPLQVEEWNAQASLLTGMAAAHIMISGGIGVLRTMPPPDEAALAEFRARVTALGQHWDQGLPYGEYLRTIHRDTPAGVAVLHAASSLFRGADYSAFGVPDADGAMLNPPEDPVQTAIAAPYAHVTAPLRRLVDRWGLVICEALCAGHDIPAWVYESLAEIPSTMRASSGFASRVNAEALDRVEAALLSDSIGETFLATVLNSRESGSRVQIEEPPVTARSSGEPLAAGEQTIVRVVSADVATGEIELKAA